MNYADYSTLKSGSKVVFKKEGGNIVLEQKQYNPETGDETNSSKQPFYLEGLESEKASLTLEKSNLEATLTELDKMIADVKAL